jgi:hypothetical protein
MRGSLGSLKPWTSLRYFYRWRKGILEGPEDSGPVGSGTRGSKVTAHRAGDRKIAPYMEKSSHHQRLVRFRQATKAIPATPLPRSRRVPGIGVWLGVSLTEKFGLASIGRSIGGSIGEKKLCLTEESVCAGFLQEEMPDRLTMVPNTKSIITCDKVFMGFLQRLICAFD